MVKCKLDIKDLLTNFCMGINCFLVYRNGFKVHAALRCCETFKNDALSVVLLTRMSWKIC